MKSLVRALIALVLLTGFGVLAVVYLQARTQKAAAPTVQQSREEADERLLRQLVHPDMTLQEAEAVPTYSDFARVLRRGVIGVIRSRDALRVQLASTTDLLDRYPPDGVPGRHLRSYLAQNSRWKVATLRSTNEQIRAIKELRGDMYAFFASHPEEYDRIGKRFEATIAEALKARRPAAAIIKNYAAARARLAPGPTPVRRAEYARAAAAYESWKRSQ